MKKNKQNPPHGHYQEVIHFFSANSPQLSQRFFFMAIFKHHCSLDYSSTEILNCQMRMGKRNLPRKKKNPSIFLADSAFPY